MHFGTPIARRPRGVPGFRGIVAGGRRIHPRRPGRLVHRRCRRRPVGRGRPGLPLTRSLLERAGLSVAALWAAKSTPDVESRAAAVVYGHCNICEFGRLLCRVVIRIRSRCAGGCSTRCVRVSRCGRQRTNWACRSTAATTWWRQAGAMKLLEGYRGGGVADPGDPVTTGRSRVSVQSG